MKKKLFIFNFLIGLLCLSFISCSSEEESKFPLIIPTSSSSVVEKTCKITFYANGADYKPIEKDLKIGSSIVLSNPYKNGWANHTFLGWSLTPVTPSILTSLSDCEYLEKSDISFTKDTDLYAVWKKNSVVSKTVKLSFFANGGKYDEKSEELLKASVEKEIEEGITYDFSEISNKFTYDGYTLLGWSKTKKTPSTYVTTYDCDVLVDGKKSFTEDVSLYAVWKKKETVNLRFYGNGGKYNNNETSEYLPAETITIDKGSEYSFSIISENFTYDGYTLLGWSKTKKTPSTYVTTYDCDVLVDGKKSFTDENVSLYAVWKKNSIETKKITVNFYANGGKFDGLTTSSYEPSIKVSLDENNLYSLSSVSLRFTCLGCTLLGWSKIKKTPSSLLSSSDCDYDAYGTAKFSSNGKEEISLYAVWKKDDQNVTGTIVNDSITIPTNSYKAISFTLNKPLKVDVNMSCSGQLNYYLLDESNFNLFKDGKSFKYYSAVSGSDVKNISSAINLNSGKYFYVIQNENIILEKTVSRKIEYKEIN